MDIFIKIVFLVGFVTSSLAQITFNGCHPLFENQNYTFNQVSIDATGRNVYTTTPIDGAQTCGGIGTCEFMIAWNDTNGVWEFLADDGNGDFSVPILIYSNIEASAPNPPSLLLGTWVENSVVTSNDCGGDLSASNALFTGDVQDTTLNIKDRELENTVSIYPNPTNEFINIQTNVNIEGIKIYDLTGKHVLSQIKNLYKINVSELKSGVYFLKINSEIVSTTKKIIIN